MESAEIGNTILMLPDLVLDNILIHLDALSTNQFLRSYEEKTDLVLRHIKIVKKRFLCSMQRMQENLNSLDPVKFDISWPLPIFRLGMLGFDFTHPEKFLRELYVFFLPLATIFEPQAAATTLTYTQCVQRMHTLSQSRFTPNNIIEFVEMAFAALWQINQLDLQYDRDPCAETKVIEIRQTRLEGAAKSIQDVQQIFYDLWQKATGSNPSVILPQPDDLVPQARYLSHLCSLLVDQLPFMTIYTRLGVFVGGPYMDKFAKLKALDLHINNTETFSTYLEMLSTQNQIQTLRFIAADGLHYEKINKEALNSLQRFTSLRQLHIFRCPFMNIETMGQLLMKSFNILRVIWVTDDNAIGSAQVFEMLRTTKPHVGNLDFNGDRLMRNYQFINYEG